MTPYRHSHFFCPPILGERLTGLALTGMALIILGLVISEGRLPLRRKKA